ncbi:MAG: glycosyltransferase family 4 protein [Actinobacteria bacterium]|nr:MAG: glycosyltransferase family 4 protein [Actinomycetota bacterium]
MALAHLRFAAMPVVTVDATDAHALALRGWGRYTARLLGALPAAADGLQLNFVSRSTPGPEFVWEQVGLARAARRAGSAVLHAPNCFLPLRRSCPGVVTVHDLAFEAHPEDFGRLTALKFRAVAPRAARSAERIICVSRFTAEDLQRRYGIGPERVRVIPLAPALPRRGRRSAGSRPQDAGPYVLGVGDLRGKKDFACLVRAWRSLRREGLPHRLVLAGLDAGEGPRLRAAAGEEPLELTGYIEDADLDALLADADVLVHPSRYEGFGLVVVEAMARSTPVVAAEATVLPETGGRAALYFPPGDDRVLAERMRAALEDRDTREQLIAAGRERAGSLSWEATAAATVAVYRELV